MKILLSLLLIILLILSAFGQDKPQPNQWKGLIIDKSSAEDAISIFGKAKEDKIDSFRVFGIDKWITKAIREKKYRNLQFKNIEGFDKVVLVFSENKLVFIHLDPKKLDPNILAKAYGIDFKPSFSGMDEALNPQDFYRNNGSIYAKRYPVFYHLIATSDFTFVVGGVGNAVGNVFGSITGKTDTQSYPGKVAYIQIVSRTLENKENMDILK